MFATTPHKKGRSASSTHNFVPPFLVTETIEVDDTAPQRLSVEGEISPGRTDLGGVTESVYSGYIVQFGFQWLHFGVNGEDIP